MRFASEFVPGATSGNTTEIDIEASPELVWKALHALRFDDLRVTRLLIGIRSLPGVALGKGPLRRRSGPTKTSPLMEAITSSRFVILHSEPDRILTLGIVGQFWKLTGGNDATVKDRATFVDFDEPGFVKSAIDFVLVPPPRRLSGPFPSATPGSDRIPISNFVTRRSSNRRACSAFHTSCGGASISIAAVLPEVAPGTNSEANCIEPILGWPRRALSLRCGSRPGRHRRTSPASWGQPR